ncbi:hypothetical protein JCM3775_000688 [Rhodotorula graminis]
MAWHAPAPAARPVQRYTAHPLPRRRFLPPPPDAAPPPTSHDRDGSRFSAAPRRHHDSAWRERVRSRDERRSDRPPLHHADDDGARPWWEDERDEAARAGRRREERERGQDESSRSGFTRRDGHGWGDGGGGTRREAPRSATLLPHYLPIPTDRLPARPPTALRVRPATKVTDPLVHLPTSLASTRRALGHAIAPHGRSHSTEAVPLRGPAAARGRGIEAPRPERPGHEASGAHDARTGRASLAHLGGGGSEVTRARASGRTPFAASLPSWQARGRPAAANEQRSPAALAALASLAAATAPPEPPQLAERP